MKLKLTLAATAFAAFVAVPAVANAAPGYTTGAVNLRTGPSTSYSRITTIPAGARIDIGRCSGWCQVSYRGYHGWVAGSYVAHARYDRRDRYDRDDRWYRDRYGRYDRRWDRDRRWWPGYRYGYREPGVGFYFGFGN